LRVSRADVHASGSAIDNTIYRLLTARRKRLFKTSIGYISKMTRNLAGHIK
jgi:hypothetical protein